MEDESKLMDAEYQAICGDPWALLMLMEEGIDS